MYKGEVIYDICYVYANKSDIYTIYMHNMHICNISVCLCDGKYMYVFIYCRSHLQEKKFK